jgi:hypothetical protein
VFRAMKEGSHCNKIHSIIPAAQTNESTGAIAGNGGDDGNVRPPPQGKT